MCRGKLVCTELGSDISKWSKNAPLMPPEWFGGQLAIFAESVRLASSGDAKKARAEVKSIRSGDLQTWFIEHGQQSGVFRDRHFKRPKPIFTGAIDPIASSDQLWKEVISRDGYRCRYCGVRLVPKEVLAAFGRIVGKDVFGVTGRNLERHGIVLAFRANADHVLPRKLGGRTHVENLVAVCWSCNYGKSNYTLEQLGIDDPRDRPMPAGDQWDGLTSFMPALKAIAARTA